MAVEPFRLARGVEARRHRPRGAPRGEAEAEGGEMGKPQRPGPQARPVAAPLGAGLRDVAEGVGARVAIGGGIGAPPIPTESSTMRRARATA